MAYLGYEDHTLHKGAATIRPQATQMIDAFAGASTGMNRQAITRFSRLPNSSPTARKMQLLRQQVLKKCGFAPAQATGTQPKARARRARRAGPAGRSDDLRHSFRRSSDKN